VRTLPPQLKINTTVPTLELTTGLGDNLPQMGNYTVTLTVTDAGNGRSNTVTGVIVVGNNRPTVTGVNVPVNSTTCGSSVSVSVTATDAEDALSALLFRYRVLTSPGKVEVYTTAFVSDTSVSFSTGPGGNIPNGDTYELEVTVKDTLGALHNRSSSTFHVDNCKPSVALLAVDATVDCGTPVTLRAVNYSDPETDAARTYMWTVELFTSANRRRALLASSFPTVGLQLGWLSMLPTVLPVHAIAPSAFARAPFLLPLAC
jgi:PKD repeat protein